MGDCIFEQKMQPIKKCRNTASRENRERYSLEKLKRVKENSPLASHVFLTSHKGLWIHEKIKLEFCIFDNCSAPWILKSWKAVFLFGAAISSVYYIEDAKSPYCCASRGRITIWRVWPRQVLSRGSRSEAVFWFFSSNLSWAVAKKNNREGNRNLFELFGLRFQQRG